MYLWLVRVCVSRIPAGHHPSPLEVNRRSWRPKPSGWLCKHSSCRPLKWEARTSAPPHKAETHRRKHVVRQYIHTSIYTCFTQEDILNLILLKVLNNTFFSCWNQQYSLHILEPIFHNHALTLLYYSTTYWVPWKWTFMTFFCDQQQHRSPKTTKDQNQHFLTLYPVWGVHVILMARRWPVSTLPLLGSTLKPCCCRGATLSQ